MDAAAIWLALLVAGVNFGWQPAKDGSNGLEYIVQVEPELLDALARGEAVPIESNVPPDVGRIRKVSIVVGRDEVPRQALGEINHTAYFAGQGTWAPDQSSSAAPAATSTYDRYATPPAASGVSPPPFVLDRAQAAVTETANTLQDGIEAGIQAANEQLSQTSEQVLESTRNAGQQFGQQLQEFATNPVGEMESAGNRLRNSADEALDAVGNQLQQVSNPFINSNAQTAASPSPQGGVSPPPWSQITGGVTENNTGQVGGAQPVRTPTGWTIIGSNTAPPPLNVPQMSTVPGRDGSLSERIASNGGPDFPQAATDTPDAASTWANSSDMYDRNTPPTNGRENAPAIRREGLDSNLVAIPQVRTTAPDLQQAASQPFDPLYGKSPWQDERQAAAGGTGLQSPGGNQDADRSGVAAWNFGSVSSSSQNDNYATGQMAQPRNGSMSSQLNTGRDLNAGTQNDVNPAVSPSTAQEPPWMPFVVVCLTLVGSLSANLFLGWSYLDARQRYRLLVRKTAETFRRVASPAA
jgi:hypothetical protein